MPAHQWNALLHGLHFERSRRTLSPAQFLAELTDEGNRRLLPKRRLVYAGAVARANARASLKVGLSCRTALKPAPNWPCNAAQVTGVDRARECSR